MLEEILATRQDAVLWLTINREERRNSITANVLDGISKGLLEAESDRRIRLVVITGAGNKAFCAGADLQDGNMFKSDPSEPYQRLALLFRQVRQSTVPIIARVNGACVAGGMGLLSMCDLAVAAEHAVFGLPEVKVGVFPAQVLAYLQYQIPRKVLTHLSLSGQNLSAAQALAIGLVNEVGSDLDATLDSLANNLLKNSPAAIRRGLYTMKAMQTMSFEASVSFAESQIALFALTEDAREGQAAFREKRAPLWTGR